ncbi:MAG: hypothetical protein IPK12_23635 [Gemmatimonadetes bacterium]|nr:hypothetical protein [Gemmatimonadota bacterium]
MSERLSLCPLSLAEANELVRRWHRHHQPVPGYKFAVGAMRAGAVCGAIVVGRPVARAYDDGWTLEVTRCVTDGSRNVPSMLYGAAQRATFALGYRRLITYTRTDESGASLRGVGWKCVAKREARSWEEASKARPRVDRSEPHERLLWEVTA